MEQQAKEYIPPLEVTIIGDRNFLPNEGVITDFLENKDLDSIIKKEYEADDIKILNWGIKLSMHGRIYIINERHIENMEYRKNPREHDS